MILLSSVSPWMLRPQYQVLGYQPRREFNGRYAQFSWSTIVSNLILSGIIFEINPRDWTSKMKPQRLCPKLTPNKKLFIMGISKPLADKKLCIY